MFDLDRCIFHQDLNRPSRVGRLLKEHGEDIVEEKWSARALARQYGVEERRPYLNRSRSEVDKARGWQFS